MQHVSIRSKTNITISPPRNNDDEGGDENNGNEDDEGVRRSPGDASLFLEPIDPSQETALEQRVQQIYNFGLSHDRANLHNRAWHDLYADIAGIARDRFDARNKAHHYQPPYSQISLPPYQTYPVGWLLGDRRRLLHYLADWPGLGKTFTTVEAMVRVTILLSLRVQIQEEFDGLDTSMDRPLHVHTRDTPYYNRNTECRANTQREYGVVCPCADNSPTARLVYGEDSLGMGYMLVLVPSGLTEQWVQEINKFLKPDALLPHSKQPIDIVDITTLSNARREGEALQNFIYGRRAHAGLGTICVAGTTILRQSNLALAKENPGSLGQQPSIIALDEAHDVKGDENLVPRLIRRLMNGAPERVHVLAISGGPITEEEPNLTPIESIATAESLERFYDDGTRAQYMQQLENAKQRLLNSAGQISRSRAIRKCGMGLGLTGQERTDALALIRQYDRAGRQYANVLPLLQRRPLDLYFGYSIPQVAPKSNPPQLMRDEMVMGTHQRAVGDEFRRWLEKCLDRRVARWNNEPRARRGPEPTMAGDLFMLETNIQVNPLNGIWDRSRILMSLAMLIPGMAKNMTPDSIRAEPTWFTADEANKIFARTRINTQRQAIERCPDYQLVWETIHVYNRGRMTDQFSSSKFTMIRTIINQMLRDRDLHEGRDANLGPLRKKAIICVPHPWHAYVLMIFLFRQYPGRNFTYIGSCFRNKAERNMLLEPFNRQTLLDDPKERDPDDPIALVSTYQYMAEGHNLTRCNYAIATSPLSSRAHELQLFSRIYRRGQGCRTHSRILMDDGDPADVVLFHRRLGRTPDSVPQAERRAGYRFLLDARGDIDDPMLID